MTTASTVFNPAKFAPANLTTSMKVRVACITGDKETLQELIDADHGIVNTPYEYGKTPLCIAAGWGHNEIVKYLIHEGADVNAGDEIGWTPLHWAAFTGNIETCRILIQAGADFTKENKAHQTPLDFEKAAQLKEEVLREKGDAAAHGAPDASQQNTSAPAPATAPAAPAPIPATTTSASDAPAPSTTTQAVDTPASDNH